MGNALGKREEEMVEGGYVFPTGTVYQKNDCDLRIIRKLITEARLAPFYKGVNESPEPSFLECPICFLYYPSNMNYSRCCNQAICTECFSQIQQPKTGGPALCPFCQLPDFGVTYCPPSQIQEPKSKGKFDPLPVESSLVISIDQIRPNGRHYPPPPEPEPIRRRTISGRPSGNRPSARRAHLSSSFTPDTLYGGNHSLRLQSPSRFNARDVEAEIENLMIMEAIQLSLMEMEQQERKNQKDRRNVSSPSSSSSSSSSSPIPSFPSQHGETSGGSSHRLRSTSDSSTSSSSSSSSAVSEGSHPDSLL